MSVSKEFPIGDVLGTITGYLLGDIAGIYLVSEFMSGHPVWTHQLPRVGREICPIVLRQHPPLTVVLEEVKAVTRYNWREMLSGWESRFGAVISLKPMTERERNPIDPLKEMMEMAPGVSIAVVHP